MLCQRLGPRTAAYFMTGFWVLIGPLAYFWVWGMSDSSFCISDLWAIYMYSVMVCIWSLLMYYFFVDTFEVLLLNIRQISLYQLIGRRLLSHEKFKATKPGVHVLHMQLSWHLHPMLVTSQQAQVLLKVKAAMVGFLLSHLFPHCLFGKHKTVDIHLKIM